MANINIKNIKTEKGLKAIFQIIILVIGIIAFAFIIGDLSKEIKIVSAAETAGNVETQNNLKLGCCFDKDEGLCDPNSLQSDCESQTKGLFFNEKYFCDINECKLGCCVLGTEAQVITATRCNKLSELYGLPSNWDASIADETACIGKSQSNEVGACVLEMQGENKNTCKFTSKEDCISIQGQFHKNYLCSNTELNTNCEKQKSTGCVEGLDEIYWYDSCGNRENIYSSNKVQSWNNGKVLSKQQSCNSGSSNSGSSSCGNCNYELGSICGTYRPGIDKKITNGEYSCRDLNCKDAIGHAGRKTNRINGESWCVYDGQIGNIGIGPVGLTSVDVVGSRHWKYACVNGEVKVEPCADYRKEICVQDSKTLTTNKKIDNAFCRVNMWEQCLGYNRQNGCEVGCIAQCANNPDCALQNTNIDKDFKFNTCVPKYPPGFDLGSTSGVGGIATSALSSQLGAFGGMLGQTQGMFSGGTSASQVCGLASKTCTVTYQKMCPGGWKCVGNCKCMETGFALQMNALCTSLGDCGVKTNIAGKSTIGGASVSKKGKQGHAPPQPMWQISVALLYTIFATPIQGQYAQPGVYDEVSAITRLPLGMLDPFLDGYSRTGAGEAEGQFGNMFGGSQLGTTVGVGVIGGVAGGVTAASLGAGGSVFGFGWTAVLGWAAAVAVAVIGLMYLLGCGKTKTTEIQFNCQPWTRPAKGKCELCNKDPLKSCTKYRCESLGMNCQIINEESDGECADIGKETKIPTITPWEEILNKTFFRYEQTSTNGFRIRDKDGECIQAFSPLIFGVKTDVYAQCRISIARNLSEGEQNYFFEGNKFTKNHTYATYLPSADSIIASETNNVDEFNQARSNETIYSYILNQVGEINLYVKCANINGQENDQDYQINFCVKPGPDLTSPVIIATVPAENSIVAFNATEQQMILFVNEPVECKWDINKPSSTNMLENYNVMQNTMSCNTDVSSGTILGFMCNTTLPITTQENKFYFLCRDQPWLEENSSRNLGAYNGGIYEYILKKSESELKINSILPNGNITRGTEPITINLEVETAGGVNGAAVCYYNLNSINNTQSNAELIKMYETGANKHLQILTSMIKGSYSANIKCIDSAGNIAYGESSFALELDSVAPEITRVYNDAGDLVILTNEDATCKFTNDNSFGCNFNLNNENLATMDGALSMIHSVLWNAKVVHYIKCEDIWGNNQGGCSIIVQPEGPKEVSQEINQEVNQTS